MKRSRLASNTEWQQWGDTDPLWGVATWEGKQRGSADPWTDESFYEVGRSDWADFARHWEPYGVRRESCVEIGCGVGRITAQLVGYFATVHGLDVSEGMLAYARPRVPKASFHLTDGVGIPLSDRSLTAAFSSHVFQHLDAPRHATPIFAEIFRVLVPSATMMIHLPIYRLPPAISALDRLFLIRQWLARQRAAARRRLGQRIMRGTWYEQGSLDRTLHGLGFRDVEFATFPTRANGDLHTIVFARKP